MSIKTQSHSQGCITFCLVFAFATISFISSLVTMRSFRESIDHLHYRRESSTASATEALRSPIVNAYTSATESVAETSIVIPTISLPPWVYFVLLALQCGCQPILVKTFTPKTVVRSTAVLAQEFVKLFVSFSYLHISGKWKSSTENWTIESAILAAGLPAGIYVIQNYCNLVANQTLPPITFSVLNQTKTLSAAFCCFVLLGKTQSSLQVVALLLLVFAALIIQSIIPINPCPRKSIQSMDEQAEQAFGESSREISQYSELSEDTKTDIERGNDPEYSGEKNRELEIEERLSKGVVPALLASFLSGLAGTLAQKTLQQHERSTHLFNTELSCFSIVFLLASLALGSPDAQSLRLGGITQGWTWKTWIPIVTNATGAILVGLVTKYHGAVLKGFTLIFGMLISGLLQHIMASRNGSGGVTLEQIIGGCLGGLSLWMHSSFPPVS